MRKRSSMASMRRTARGVVVKAMYQMEMGGLDADGVRAQVRQKCSRSEDVEDFACRLADETLANLTSIDGIIGRVAENSRIGEDCSWRTRPQKRFHTVDRRRHIG